MSEMRFRPPEKSYFSVEEIANRWQCTAEQVIHYVNEGMLRPAIRSSELDAFRIFDISRAEDIEAKQGRTFQASLWGPPCELAVDTVNEAEIAVEGLPRYFYINLDWLTDQSDCFQPDSFRVSGHQFCVSILESLEAFPFGLFSVDSASALPAYFDLNPICHENMFAAPVRKKRFSWISSSILLTREEVDRFERVYGAFPESTGMLPDRSSYTTAYLEIMQEAISTFFEPRHKRDPKKWVVEAWILEKLESRGLRRSGNIASTMFTIIKPHDHNPKKDKG